MILLVWQRHQINGQIDQISPCKNKRIYDNCKDEMFIFEPCQQNNPLKFNTKHHHRYYEYKIKKFLTEIAVGMMRGTVWEGVYDATGGYLVVRKDGEILAYHLYNRNEFEDYLFHNTKLDTASSSRHRFGQIYEEDGAYFFKLNLQIRFVK